MKKIIFKATFMLAMIIPFLGCSSDDSRDLECPTINCQNGGVFQNCSCNCPQGYTGTNCETRITPKKVLITNIDVKSFPNLNQGSNWDIINPAGDLFVKIETATSILFSSNQYYPDAISTGTNYFPFTVQPALNITNVSVPHYITLWDYDAAPFNNEIMGVAAFYPYESSRGFPNKITVSNIQSQIITELTLQYEW